MADNRSKNITGWIYFFVLVIVALALRFVSLDAEYQVLSVIAAFICVLVSLLAVRAKANTQVFRLGLIILGSFYLLDPNISVRVVGAVHVFAALALQFFYFTRPIEEES